jgi:hypothetical protein
MQRYAHSGIVPVAGAIRTVLSGLVAATIGGLVYAFLAYWISWGIIRAILMVVYSLSLGGVLAYAANRGKIRSPLFNTVASLVCVAVGLWVYWGAFDVARNGVGAAATAWTPQGLVRHGQDLFEKGSFTMKGKNKVKGWLLVAAWIAEGLFVTGIVLAMSLTDAWRPFCESCLEWTESTSGLMRFAADGKEPAWQEVLSGDLTAVATFAPAHAGTSPHVRLDLASCPKCLHSNFVTLTSVTIKKDSKGKTKTVETTLITNGAITDPEAEFLRQYAEQLHGRDGGDEEEEEGEFNGGEEEGEDSGNSPNPA